MERAASRIPIWEDAQLHGPKRSTVHTSRKDYGKHKFALPDLEIINNAAYFDYQREKVFLRTNDAIRKARTKRRRVREGK